MLQDLKNHKFVFVIGAHHSGTSLINLMLQRHPDLSGLRNTGVPEDEGQHLQNVYKSAKRLGGILLYADHSESHIDDSSPLINDANRLLLYSSWAKFWNTSRPILVEKSPPHTLMTRFLQAMFSPERTYFIATMRHPLAAYFWHWKDKPALLAVDCGRRYIRHWLKIYNTLIADVPKIQHFHIVKIERFLSSREPQKHVDAIFRFLERKESIPITTTCKSFKGNFRHSRLVDAQLRHLRRGSTPTPVHTRISALNANVINSPLCQNFSEASDTSSSPLPEANARRLLMFHGDRDGVHIGVNDHMDWIKTMLKYVDLGSEMCVKVREDFEESVNEFGYSLKHLRRIDLPTNILSKFASTLN